MSLTLISSLTLKTARKYSSVSLLSLIVVLAGIEQKFAPFAVTTPTSPTLIPFIQCSDGRPLDGRGYVEMMTRPVCQHRKGKDVPAQCVKMNQDIIDSSLTEQFEGMPGSM